MKYECVYCLWYDMEKGICSHDKWAECMNNDPNYFEEKEWEESMNDENDRENLLSEVRDQICGLE